MAFQSSYYGAPTPQLTSLVRVCAGVIALAGWAGLAIQLDASLAKSGSLGASLWSMLRFFTVISNLILALFFTGIALGFARLMRPRAIGGMTLTMLLVGVVYHLLLRGLVELSAGAMLANVLLHKVTPLLAAGFWLAFAVKGGLRFSDPLRWTALPLAYLGYALGRGAIDGVYPYPFMDVASIGWTRTLANSAAIAAGFLVAGYALVFLDRLLAGRERRSSARSD
ncbi:Pr6Pr family membrane protein [Sphingomonas sp. DT-207]|uniref:Pr6Pr family membrane protein n=1 Tax=Sphingomonas sp. DT-207 TaxID=3396167 RepID=UPI003F1A7893